jgi:hypothetical protein
VEWFLSLLQHCVLGYHYHLCHLSHLWKINSFCDGASSCYALLSLLLSFSKEDAMTCWMQDLCGSPQKENTVAQKIIEEIHGWSTATREANIQLRAKQMAQSCNSKDDHNPKALKVTQKHWQKGGSLFRSLQLIMYYGL